LHRFAGGLWYEDTLRAHSCYAPLAKYFIVCITYQQTYVESDLERGAEKILSEGTGYEDTMEKFK